MIPYTEFSFSNIIGKCLIKKEVRGNDGTSYIEVDKKEYPKSVGEYKHYIIEQATEDSIVPIYPHNTISDVSVLMEYIAVDTTRPDSILSFCNKYGMPHNIKYSVRDDHDYIFNSTSIEQSIFEADLTLPFNEPFRLSISLFKMAESISSLRRIVSLYSALNTKDYLTIIDVVLYALVNDHKHDAVFNKNSLGVFNYYFREYVDDTRLPPMTKNEQVLSFLDEIEQDTLETETMPQYSGDYSYPQHKHKLWQAIIVFLRQILNKYQIQEFSNDYHVIYDKELIISEIINDEYPEEDFILLSNAIFLDLMNVELQDIHPEFIVIDSQLVPNWRISSLEQAMAAELFTIINPFSQIKKCANPTCNHFFSTSTDNSRKIYCSTSCAQLMAKRKQRAREKSIQ